MKKLIYALLISLIVFAAPSFAAPNWKYAGAVNGNKLYVDFNSICVAGGGGEDGCAHYYTAKMVLGGAGKKTFDNHYGQPVATIIDQWSLEGGLGVYNRKIYDTSGKLIKPKKEDQWPFFGNSESSQDSFEKVLENYVNKACQTNKIFDKLDRLQKKHRNKYVTLYITGKVKLESLQ